LSNARKSGFLASAYPILIFVDDDNWLVPEYLTIAASKMNVLRHAAMIGGMGIAAFESEPPDWFGRFSKSYAVGAQAESYNSQPPRELYGAGLVVRKKFLERLYSSGFSSLLSDRRGNELVSGGDTEWCIWCRYLGYDLVYEPTLQFTHFIPSSRLTKSYLIRRSQGKGKTEAIFNIYHSILERNAKPTFIKNRFAWYFRILTRLSKAVMYLFTSFTFERILLAHLLWSSVRFRISNRQLLLRNVEAISGFIEKLH
jgi:hypothetical protein